MARVQHYGPFIGVNLAPRATHGWTLGPLPKLFESTADVNAHPRPHGPKAGDLPPAQRPTQNAEIAVTSVHSQITPAGERFLVFTVQNLGETHIDGYNVRATLTSSAR
ncbi:MAG TPA: hypothetical protein VFR32_02930 [Gaiellaceae bacterium]|nr:hypothetical protein [Gaiellaceae bacterium]